MSGHRFIAGVLAESARILHEGYGVDRKTVGEISRAHNRLTHFIGLRCAYSHDQTLQEFSAALRNSTYDPTFWEAPEVEYALLEMNAPEDEEINDAVGILYSRLPGRSKTRVPDPPPKRPQRNRTVPARRGRPVEPLISPRKDDEEERVRNDEIEAGAE